jgi:hypothetical protein
MHIGIIHYASPPVVGGVELTIFHHARVLIALGHQVTIVSGQGTAFLPQVNYRAEPLIGSAQPGYFGGRPYFAAGQRPR